MSQRWKKVTLAVDELPLVVLWSEMLAATGIPDARAWQLVQENNFPIKDLPYYGYAPPGGRPGGRRSQIDPRYYTFAKVEVLRFLALDEYHRHQATLLDWERPKCCQCPLHCPPHGQVQQEHLYAARFKRRWWNQ